MWPAILCFSHRSYLPYGWTTSPWCVKSKPFHLCLLRFFPTAAGNASSTACLCMWGGHHLFPGLVFNLLFAEFGYVLAWNLSCLYSIWLPALVPGFQAVLSSFWREKFSLQLDTSQCCLKFWIQDTQGLCIVLSWVTSLYWICCHTRSSVCGGGVDKGFSVLPRRSLDLASLGLSCSSVFTSQPGAQSILSSLSVLSYIWVESSFSKIASLAFKFFKHISVIAGHWGHQALISTAISKNVFLSYYLWEFEMGDFSLQTWFLLLIIYYKAYSNSLRKGPWFIWKDVFSNHWCKWKFFLWMDANP